MEQQASWDRDLAGTKPMTLTELAETMIKTHGMENFREHMYRFAEKLKALGELNRQLSEEEIQQNASRYDALVQSIMEATQSYYSFIGGLSEDMRRFFLVFSDCKDEEELKNVELMLGDIHIDSSPLLTVRSIRPKSYIMQVDAITSQLATLGEETQLRVGKKGSQPVNTTVTLDMPDHMRIEGGGALSTYDKSIINGVTSLLESGNPVFSIPMLYHAMTGKQNPTVDEQLSEELQAKLEKMRRMMLTIDLTEENEARYINGADGGQLKIENVQLEGYLLPLNKVAGTVNGKRAELYQIIQHPPLYTYSKMKRQLASVRIALLDAPVNNNATTIPLKTYLLQRIELMKNRRNHIVSYTILYESVYRELGALDAGKTRKMRIRSYTTTILQHFLDEGYIAGFAEYKKGRSIAGVAIEL